MRNAPFDPRCLCKTDMTRFAQSILDVWCERREESKIAPHLFDQWERIIWEDNTDSSVLHMVNLRFLLICKCRCKVGS